MSNLTVTDIKQAIMFGDFTPADMEVFADAIKYARSQLGRKNANTISVGSSVKFRDNKRGINYIGTLEKVKQKYALVRTAQGRYNVPLNLLETA